MRHVEPRVLRTLATQNGPNEPVRSLEVTPRLFALRSLEGRSNLQQMLVDLFAMPERKLRLSLRCSAADPHLALLSRRSGPVWAK